MTLLDKVKSDCDKAKTLGDNSHDLIELYFNLYQTNRDIICQIKRENIEPRNIAQYCLTSIVSLTWHPQLDLDTIGHIVKIRLDDAQYYYKTDPHYDTYRCSLEQLIKEGISLFNGRGSEKLTEVYAIDLYNKIMDIAIKNRFYFSALDCLLVVLQTNALPSEKLNYGLVGLNNALAADRMLLNIVERHPQALAATDLLITHMPPDNSLGFDTRLSEYSHNLKNINNRLKAEKIEKDPFLANKQIKTIDCETLDSKFSMN